VPLAAATAPPVPGRAAQRALTLTAIDSAATGTGIGTGGDSISVTIAGLDLAPCPALASSIHSQSSARHASNRSGESTK
jgi:hypothetical protein